MPAQHSYSCPFPEGCNCGASEANHAEAELHRLREENAKLREENAAITKEVKRLRGILLD